MENIENLKKFWNKKKVFVTGHTGFKGSWLCIILKYLKSNVYGYALKPERLSLFNKSKIKRNLSLNTYSDINDLTKLKKKIKSIKPEIIFHLAAQPFVLESYKKPLKTFNTNIIGTYNLLEVSRKYFKNYNDKTNKFLFLHVSTDEVYGSLNHEEVSFLEEVSSLNGSGNSLDWTFS